MREEAKKCYEIIDRVTRGKMGQASIIATMVNIRQTNPEIPDVLAAAIAMKLMQATVRLTYMEMTGLGLHDVIDPDMEEKMHEDTKARLSEQLGDEIHVVSRKKHLEAATLLRNLMREEDDE